MWLFYRLMPTSLPTYQKCEFVVGEATLDLSLEEIVNLFRMLYKKSE